jgi:hypothetical protein
VERSASAKGTVVLPDEQGVDVELPVTWSEDGEAEVVFTLEFNDEEVLVHHPAETWHSGRMWWRITRIPSMCIHD